MHSDYLNEDKICEMFQQDQDSGPKRQQVSLNLTVTSRESRSLAIGQGNPMKCYIHLQQNQNNPHTNSNSNLNLNLPNNFNSNSTNNLNINPSDSVYLALNQLNKFNNWMNSLNKNSEKLLDDLSTITTYAQNNRSILLDMPDFSYIRKKYSKSVKIAGEDKMHGFVKQKECIDCKNKQDLIQVIQEEYKIKVQECGLYNEKAQKYQKLYLQQVKAGLRNTLIQGVQYNMLKQQVQNLNSQIVTLKMQIDRSRLQKSSLMQKSTTFLKTKDILEKRLQSGNCNNSKLFSNAKYSTNALNPNDTMNRGDSIMCFGDTEPNLQELIRYYNEQSQFMKNKCKEMLTQQQKRTNKKFHSKQARGIFLNEKTQHILYNVYKIMINKLIYLKQCKEKCPYLFSVQPRERKLDQYYATNISSSTNNQQMIEQHKRIIMDLEKKIQGIENQNNNLIQTNSDLIKQLNDMTYRTRELQLRTKKMYEDLKNQSIQKKKYMFEIEQIRGNIRVYCRVRPRFGVQLKQKLSFLYGEDNKIIKDGKEFQFDYVFNDKTSQKDIFHEVKGLVQWAYEGKNLCIFSYGQTGSGKTYTIHGDKANPGLSFNIIDYLYQMIQKDNKHSTTVSMSIVQIYKQQIRDLTGVCGTGKMQIKQSNERGVYLQQCKPIRVKTRQQLLQIYNQGMINRSSSHTQINADSSRSHCIFTLYIEKSIKRVRDHEKQCRVSKISKICLIDLAGAQKLSSSNPLVAKQTQFINKSLSSLVTVLSSLRAKNDHIPYRDSKLTYLLKQFLSTKCNILTFINISACEQHTNQTSNSLLFGARVKTIERNYSYSKSKETKDLKEARQLKQNKETQKNRRSSARLSIS